MKTASFVFVSLSIVKCKSSQFINAKEYYLSNEELSHCILSLALDMPIMASNASTKSTLITSLELVQSDA